MRIWRVSAPLRLASAALLVILGFGTIAFIGGAFALLASGEFVGWLALMLAGVLFGFMARQLWAQAWRPALTLTEDEVIVRNPWEVRKVALTDLTAADPGYSGITLTVRGGQPIVAWAVQKWNLATWLHIPSRADDVAHDLMAAALAAGGSTSA